jgi:formiminoglutamase
MLDLNDYLNPVSIERPIFDFLSEQAGFPHNITIHTDNSPVQEPGKFRIAIIGVPEGRNSPDPGSVKAPDAVRQELYRMSKIPGKLKIIDLGNMKQGTSFNDTVAGLADVLSFLVSEKVFPVIIGGSSSLIIAIDKAFSSQKMKYRLASVDPRIDYNSDKKGPGCFSYMNSILAGGSALEHFVNIGYQTYLNDQQVINRFLKRKFDLVRIGEVRQSIHLMEPLFRDSDAAVFDISAVRQSDAPGTSLPSPNGFYGEEICLLSRYAGISDSLKIFGLFDVNPDFDTRSQTAGLAAQIIWFFLEGYSQKQFETPVLGSSSGRFIKYHVHITDLEENLIFIKSNLTERWWFELSPENDASVYVACSHEDYLQANRNEVPERWIRAVERMK